jgi:hypothetical protein
MKIGVFSFLFASLVVGNVNPNPTVALITPTYDPDAKTITLSWQYSGPIENAVFHIYRAFEQLAHPTDLIPAKKIGSQAAAEPFTFTDRLLITGTLYYAITVEVDGVEYKNMQYDQSYLGEGIEVKLELPIDHIAAIFDEDTNQIHVTWEYIGTEEQESCRVKLYRTPDLRMDELAELTPSRYLEEAGVTDERYVDTAIRRGVKYWYTLLVYYKEQDWIMPIVIVDANALRDPVGGGLLPFGLPPYPFSVDILPDPPSDQAGIGPPQPIKPSTPTDRWTIYTQFDHEILPEFERIIVGVPHTFIRDELGSYAYSIFSETDSGVNEQNLDPHLRPDYRLRLVITQVYFRDRDYARAAMLLEQLSHQTTNERNRYLAILFLARSYFHLEAYEEARYYLLEIKNSAYYSEFKALTDIFVELVHDRYLNKE